MSNRYRNQTCVGKVGAAERLTLTVKIGRQLAGDLVKYTAIVTDQEGNAVDDIGEITSDIEPDLLDTVRYYASN